MNTKKNQYNNVSFRDIIIKQKGINYNIYNYFNFIKRKNTIFFN